MISQYIVFYQIPSHHILLRHVRVYHIIVYHTILYHSMHCGMSVSNLSCHIIAYQIQYIISISYHVLSTLSKYIRLKQSIYCNIRNMIHHRDTTDCSFDQNVGSHWLSYSGFKDQEFSRIYYILITDKHNNKHIMTFLISAMATYIHIHIQ